MTIKKNDSEVDVDVNLTKVMKTMERFILQINKKLLAGESINTGEIHAMSTYAGRLLDIKNYMLKEREALVGSVGAMSDDELTEFLKKLGYKKVAEKK